MEHIVVKTRSMLQIIKSLVEQINLFSLYYNVESDDFPEPEVENICSPLLELKDDTFSNDVVLLKVSLRDFYDYVDSMKQQKENTKNNDLNRKVFQNLLLCVYNFLTKKDSVTTKKILQFITKCNNHFTEFVKNINNEECKPHLQGFVACAKECLRQVRVRTQDIIDRKQQQQLLLCVRQISKSVSLLVVALRSQSSTTGTQLLYTYLSKRISWCFLELHKAIESSSDSFQEKECGGKFVRKMDAVMDILSTELMAPSEELKIPVNEVLCHAMSIAHVAVEADCTNISCSCQKVLRALEEVAGPEQTPVQPPMQALLLGSLSEALEQLEKQVNTALLRLVLEVLSALFCPLESILHLLDHPRHDGVRCHQDLDGAVAVFDLQMDRVVQIGLFAAACSQDTPRIVGICSCLASLESLEPELVPALTALYLEPASAAHRSYLRVLVRHWRDEVTELQGLLHGTVDPGAFCEIILQDVKHIVSSIKKQVPNAGARFWKQQIHTALKKAAILQQQLNISLKEEYGDVLPSHLSKILEDLSFSCIELKAASELFLSDVQVEKVCVEECRRLMKRCEILVSTIKKVRPLLDTSGTSYKENLSGKDETFAVLDRFFFPNSLEDLPVDQDSDITRKEDLTLMKRNFTELVKRGKALTKERSILYCTPKKNWEYSVKFNHALTPQIRNCTVFNRTANRNDNLPDQTLGLDISNILDNLTSLSDTLTSSNTHQDFNSSRELCLGAGDNVELHAVPALSDSEIKLAVDSFLSALKSPTTPVGSTFDLQSFSQEVDSLQRLDDLKAVQLKIANLRTTGIHQV